MCLFIGNSRPVTVSATRIFARNAGERQLLAYEMRLSTAQEIAMVLPLPTASTAADALKFLDLSDYSNFFDDLDACFPRPAARSFGALLAGGMPPQTLAVHRVGAFDASFVPEPSAFSRLDARFRLPEDMWEEFPEYRDYGFAVFQLRAGESRVHPMALSFLTRDPASLFFPTTHVHDGTVHPTAEFDHTLFAQGGVVETPWFQGGYLPKDVMRVGGFLHADPSKGLVDGKLPALRCDVKGTLPNADHWLRTA